MNTIDSTSRSTFDDAVDPPTPEYTPLLVMVFLFWICGGITFLVGGAYAAKAMSERNTPGDMPLAIGLLLASLLYVGGGSLLDAVRDIAINSWHTRFNTME